MSGIPTGRDIAANYELNVFPRSHVIDIDDSPQAGLTANAVPFAGAAEQAQSRTRTARRPQAISGLPNRTMGGLQAQGNKVWSFAKEQPGTTFLGVSVLGLAGMNIAYSVEWYKAAKSSDYYAALVDQYAPPPYGTNTDLSSSSPVASTPPTSTSNASSTPEAYATSTYPAVAAQTITDTFTIDQCVGVPITTVVPPAAATTITDTVTHIPEFGTLTSTYTDTRTIPALPEATISGNVFRCFNATVTVTNTIAAQSAATVTFTARAIADATDIDRSPQESVSTLLANLD